MYERSFHKLFKEKLILSNMKIVPTPEWFIGKDILIEFFSFFVLAIFFILAFKSYKLNKSRRLFHLGAGFGLVALAQLASIITKLVLYYDIGPSQEIGQAIISSGALSSVDIFYYIGFFLHRFLTLAGFFIIYKIPREKSGADYILIMYFIFLSALLSNEFYYLFHLTAFFILGFIVKDYYQIYKKNKFENTKNIMIAFSILALAQIIYLVSKIPVFFAVANTIELISYAILLAVIVRILKNGKKKKPYGDNLGYAGSNSRKRKRH